MVTVYKYCGKKGLNILKNLEIKITPPNEFNDPFEFTPRMLSTNPARGAKNILRNKKLVATLYNAELTEGTFRGTFREDRKHLRRDRIMVVKQMSQYVPLAAAKVGKELANKVSRSRGVLCVSEVRDSILMWGHYCEGHTGMVIGFDGSHQVFTPNVGYGMRPVRYVRERVLFDSSWRESDPRLLGFEEAMIFSKNADWKYEQERRQLFMLAHLKCTTSEGAQTLYFLSVPPEAILSVSLGARCPEELERSVKEALTQPPLSHVTLDRAELHDTEFSLNFVSSRQHP
jgi:Protein of unknown function (DUF2971)